jgi:hypothetical protein
MVFKDPSSKKWIANKYGSGQILSPNRKGVSDSLTKKFKTRLKKVVDFIANRARIYGLNNPLGGELQSRR